MFLSMNSRRIWCSAILGLIVIALSYYAYATSPSSLTNQASLKDNLATNSAWFICEVVDAQPSHIIGKHIKDATEFACLNHDNKNRFVAGHRVILGERFLILDQNANFILLPNYSIVHSPTQPPDNMVNASSLGKISGALRVTDVQVGRLSEEYIMVPSDWASPRYNFNGVGAVKVDYSVSIPCKLDNCGPEKVAYFLVPKREVMKIKGSD
jgi:hypothetical protein